MFKFLLLILITFFFNSNALLSQTFVEEFRLGQEGQQSREFNRPLALAASQDGILFVVDSGNNRLQLFDLKGHWMLVAAPIVEVTRLRVVAKKCVNLTTCQ